MQNKIALEEHFAIEATLGDSKVFGGHVWDTLGPRLLDIQDMRLTEMDKHGVELMILSLNAPAVQAIHDTKRAIEVAREANDVLAAEVRKRPDRFAAFAALPMQDAGRGRRRAHPLRQGTRFRRRAGQRLLAAWHAGERALLRRVAIPAVLENGGGARRAVLPAPAQSATELEQVLRGPQLAARSELGLSRRDRGARAAANRRRACSTNVRS